ncbi:MAG: acetylpolyamine amidohydrolase, partial [Candidatus Brocadiia bacterium]
MIKIVRIYRMTLPVEKERIAQVQEIFRQNFPDVADYASKIPSQLDNPIQYGYTSVLLVSETLLGRVNGFSLFFYFPDIRCALLDFLAVRNGTHGSGTGGALYEATREYLKEMECLGLYMEAMPDDPGIVKDPAILKENQRRLKFYEGYGVRPICGTEFETSIEESPAPHLLYDSLGNPEPLKRSRCRSVMRTILTKKYGQIVSPDYIKNVVESVIDDPVKIREPRYIKKITASVSRPYKDQFKKPFVMVSSTEHEVHHVNDRGYVERPVRVKAIRDALELTNLFESIGPRHFGQKNILAVHDTDFVKYLKAVCQKLQSNRPVYPYVFPIRRPERRPKDLAVRAGYY